MFGKMLLKMRQRHARRMLLTKIYEPASKLQKGFAEYEKLATSGRLWEDHFQPGSSRLMGYVGLQRELRDTLAEIDLYKSDLPYMSLSRYLVPEYAQQSVMIEGNPSRIDDACQMFGLLRERGLGMGSMTGMPSSELAAMHMPQTDENESPATVELKNHIIASQWVADNAATKPGTAGLGEIEVRDLAAATIRGTSSEAVYNFAWGGRVPLGGYRKLPIQVQSNHLAVFPYPQEVPACMRRFFEWRDAQHAARELHPLILACQMTAYFVHIHPFPDGNGRVSRMIMQDYMARQGYPPTIFPDMDRARYLRVISEACEGRPREFVNAVIEAQLVSGDISAEGDDVEYVWTSVIP